LHLATDGDVFFYKSVTRSAESIFKTP